MRLRKVVPWVVVGALVASALTACSSDDSGSGSGTVRIGVAEPRYLSPGNTSETSGAQVMASLFTSLVDFDENNKPFPVAAESITSSDNKTWRVKLKDTFTFHNDEKVTSDSYLNAWNFAALATNAQENATFFDRIEGYAAVNPADPDGEGPLNPAAPTAQTMSGLKKVDDTTFDVVLAEPFSGFQAMLGYTAFYPLPTAFYANPQGFNEAPIGNGAFKMKGSWEHNVKIEAERYDKYPGTKPKIAGVVFQIFQDTSVEYDAVLANNLDVQKQVPTDKLNVVGNDFGDRYLHSPASTFQAVSFPTYFAGTQDVRIRRAISKAIDRELIIQNVFKGTQKAAYGWISPIVAGYRENACGDACKFDVAAAKALFQEAGGTATLPKISIMYNVDGGHKDWVDATCNMLQNNLGVECVGAPDPKFADMLNKLDAGQATGMFRFGWVMDYPNADNYLAPLYATGGSSNYSKWSNADFDRLVKEGNAAPSQDEAITKYQQAEDVLAANLPALPLRFGQNNFVHSTKVKNVEINQLFYVDLFEIETT